MIGIPLFKAHALIFWSCTSTPTILLQWWTNTTPTINRSVDKDVNPESFGLYINYVLYFEALTKEPFKGTGADCWVSIDLTKPTQYHTTRWNCLASIPNGCKITPKESQAQIRAIAERGVLFLREVKQSGRNVIVLKGGEGAQALADGNSVILSAVNDQGGGLPVLDQSGGVPLFVAFGVFPGNTTILPDREPQLFSGIEHGSNIKHSVMVNQALEGVCLRLKPVNHVAWNNSS